MEVSLSILGEVEIDDDIDSLDVDTSGEEIYLKTNQMMNSLCCFWITLEMCA